MEKLTITQIDQSKYKMIITVFDYELSLNNALKQLHFDSLASQYIVVDLALHAGINQYRFVEFLIDNDGKIILNSNKYINDTSSIESHANAILKEHKDIVLHSILTEKQKNYILN